MLKQHPLRLVILILLFLGLPLAPPAFGAADFLSTRQFVEQQYLDFLNRQGEVDGINFWVQEIESGRQSRADLVVSFLRSAEFQGNTAPVVRLYFAYFQRMPDYEGLTYWTGEISKGVPLQAVSNAFAASQEFISTYGSLSNRDFIDRVYLNILGRPADAGGLDYWTQQLDSGALDRGGMMIAFSESEEYRSIIGNEVDVTMTYVGLLRRVPDPSGFEYWVSALDQGPVLLNLIEPFLNSDEYAARFDDGYPINIAQWTIDKLWNPFTQKYRCVMEQSEAGVNPMIFGVSIKHDGSSVPFVTFAGYSSRFPADPAQTRLFIDQQEIPFSSIDSFDDIRSSLQKAGRFSIVGPSRNVVIAKFNDNHLVVDLAGLDEALSALDVCAGKIR